MAHYRSFTNRKCEFYPCHKTDRLNCLFCFCPLYFLDCGGNFTRTGRGVKDCSQCLLPHTDDGYDYIVRKLTENAERCGCVPVDADAPASGSEPDSIDESEPDSSGEPAPDSSDWPEPEE